MTDRSLTSDFSETHVRPQSRKPLPVAKALTLQQARRLSLSARDRENEAIQASRVIEVPTEFLPEITELMATFKECPAEHAPKLTDLIGIFKDCPMEKDPWEDSDFVESVIDALKQWRYADQQCDHEELDNARAARDTILGKLKL